MVRFRSTLFGKASYFFGKAVAVVFIFRIALSSKQVVQPVYSEEVIDKTTRQALLYFKLHAENNDDLALAVSVQYIILAVTAILIVMNVQSFFKKLLVTLKNLLRDNNIQISFQTSLLTFSFVMGSYYLSILLQMSMNLPAERRASF